MEGRPQCRERSSHFRWTRLLVQTPIPAPGGAVGENGIVGLAVPAETARCWFLRTRIVALQCGAQGKPCEPRDDSFVARRLVTFSKDSI